MQDLSFIHDSFVELLECRSFLQHSYALGFYRYAKARKKVRGRRRTRVARALEDEKETFEGLQSELEMLTEQMSDIVARQHLRASKTQVIAATSLAREKRQEMNLRQVGVLAEMRSELEAKIIAERGEVRSGEEQEIDEGYDAARTPPPLRLASLVAVASSS